MIKLLIFIILNVYFVRGNVDTGRIRSSNRFLVDSYGRVKLFHGVNAVRKQPDWLPNAGHLNLTNSTILNYLQEWGFNAVRLGVMWSGLRPNETYINMTYLNEIINIIDSLADKGIYTIIDMHQDFASTKYDSYDGFPLWLLNKMPQPTFAYPWPFTQDNLGFTAYLTDACGVTFQFLYNNTNSFQDYFAEYWTIVAKNLFNRTSVLGYELINEPWAGDIYLKPDLLLPAKAGLLNLAPLYDNIHEIIRKVDQETLIFYEPVTWGALFNGNIWGSGFNRPPGNDTNGTVLAWHYYCWLLQFNANPLVNGSYPVFDRVFCDDLQRYFAFYAIQQDRQLLGSASFLTEFGVCDFGFNGTQNTQECEYILDSTDKFFESWTYWDSDFFTENFQINQQLVNIFSRIYPVSTSGTPLNMFYNTTTKVFVYSFQINPSIQAPTEIFIPKHVYLNSEEFKVSASDNVKWEWNESQRLVVVTSMTKTESAAVVQISPTTLKLSKKIY